MTMLPALIAHNLSENTIRDIQGDFLSNNTTHISIYTSEGASIPTVEEGQLPRESPRIPITHKNDLSFVRSPAYGSDLVARDGYRIHAATYRGKVVAVKVYQGSDAIQKLEADLEINISLFHPTIFKTVAVCKATQAPFVVLSSDSLSAIPLSLGGFKSLACRLADALNHSEKESVVLGAQLIRNISSGLDYLASIEQTLAVSRLTFDLLVDESNNICITVGLGEGDAGRIQEDGYPRRLYKLCVKGFLEANNECHLDKPQVLTTAAESGYDPDLVFSQSVDERTMETSFESDCSPRREYAFIPDRTIGSLSLRRISTEYASFLRRINNNVQRLQHKGRSNSTAVAHRCPGYRRDEVTLGTSVLRTAIIQHLTPSPREICPVCQQLVEDGTFHCSCGQGMISSVLTGSW
ncbi:hypothetical protein C8J56DRAFT_261245 [Mycena floridula]|nr:hypothetical protein C8J56DRAFT_261245 [Mycena floridula]